MQCYVFKCYGKYYVMWILWKKFWPDEMLCAICYYLYNLRAWKTPIEECNFTKNNTSPWVFSRYLNYTNGTKSCKALQMYLILVSETMHRSGRILSDVSRNKSLFFIFSACLISFWSFEFTILFIIFSIWHLEAWTS